MFHRIGCAFDGRITGDAQTETLVKLTTHSIMLSHKTFFTRRLKPMKHHIKASRRFLTTTSASLLAAPFVHAQAALAKVFPRTPDNWSFNTRTRLAPTHIARVKSETTAQAAFQRATASGKGFSLRSGGHCFEGLSQHPETAFQRREAGRGRDAAGLLLAPYSTIMPIRIK